MEEVFAEEMIYRMTLDPCAGFLKFSLVILILVDVFQFYLQTSSDIIALSVAFITW